MFTLKKLAVLISLPFPHISFGFRDVSPQSCLNYPQLGEALSVDVRHLHHSISAARITPDQ